MTGERKRKDREGRIGQDRIGQREQHFDQSKAQHDSDVLFRPFVVRSFVRSGMHSVGQSVGPSASRSVGRWFLDSFFHLSVGSIMYSLVRSFVRSFRRSFRRSVGGAFVHSLTRSSLIPWSVRSCGRSRVFVCSFVFSKTKPEDGRTERMEGHFVHQVHTYLA